MTGISTHRNVGEDIDTVTSILPQTSGAAAVAGSSIDRYSYGDAMSCVLHHVAGAVSGSPTTTSVSTVLEDSATGSGGWNTVPGSGSPTVLTAQNSEASVSIDLSPAKRFIRAKTTVAFTGGSSPAALIAADVILGGQQELPAA